MVARLCVAAAVLALACGSRDANPDFGPTAGAAGTTTTAGTSATGGGGASQGGSVATAGAATAGAGGVTTSAGSAGTPGGSGGQPDAQAGTTSGGGSSAGTGGEPSGGKPSQGGSAGKSSGGAGGQGGDPLEPKPVPGCPGFVKVVIPHNTCAWFHGSFKIQSDGCDTVNPPEQTCAVASAVSKDISGIISEGVEITRFDFDQTGCPKHCN